MQWVEGASPHWWNSPLTSI